MRRIAAVALTLTLALLPLGLATPAQAVAAFAPGSSLNNPANAPILVQLGIVSGGGATAATGATAAAVSTGVAGTLGFKTVVGASVAAVGLMTLKGVEAGLFLQTDPAHAPDGPPAGHIGPQTFTSTTGTGTITVAASYSPATGLLSPISVSSTVTVCSGMAIAYRASNGAFGNLGGGSTWTFGPCPGGNVTPAPVNIGTLPSTGVIGWSPNAAPTAAQLANIVGWIDGLPAQRAAWVGEDHPAYQPGAPAGYLGTIRTTVTCALSGGGTTYVEAFAEVDVPQGDDLPIPPATCPSGSIAIFAAFDYRATGTTAWIGVGSSEAPDFVNDLPVSYPDCFNTVRECVVELWKVDAGGSLTSCGPIGQYCPDWAREATMNPEMYRCAYGPYGLDLANCSMYRSPGVGVLPNDSGETAPDGKPVPLPITAPVPDPLPNPVTDPLTGTPVPLPSQEAEQHSRECFPTGWGALNPVSWVLMPVQCALQWAFVPRSSEIALRLEQLRFRVNGWVAPVVTIVTAITASIDVAASGCQGPPLRLNLDFGPFGGVDETFYPMNACDAPMDAVASAVNGMISFSVIAFTGLAVVRYFMTIFGYVPFGSANTGSSVMFRETGD